ncbi:MAG: hypothetical protein COU33_00270, partial [Candidatus Magasanikbacteria bacterium CG10_big_fil_rev_8_21_14_0_10_43_6]
MRTIKEIPKTERPREKLIQYGPEKLSNSELLAILLRTGGKGEHVVKLAHRILSRFPAGGIAHAEHKALANCRGIGPTKACEI